MNDLMGLLPGNILELNGTSYRLKSIAGEGGSSIVYLAKPISGTSSNRVMIKELFPKWPGIKRITEGPKKGEVFVHEKMEHQFDILKAKASDEANTVKFLIDDRKSKLKNKKAKDPYTNNNPHFFSYDKPCKKNNTRYTVIQTESGNMLSLMINKDDDFFENKDFAYICNCIKRILITLKVIHDKKYLHLDISPDNLFFSDLSQDDTSPGIARLIDYNSAFPLGGDPSNWLPSYKKGYSAPELYPGTNSKPKALTYSHDLFSVAAIFFRLLVKRPLEDEDWGHGNPWELNNKTGYLKDRSIILVNKTNEFLRDALSLEPAKRFKCVEKMIKAVNELLDLSKEQQLIDKRTPPNEHFVGRKEEIGKIDEALQEKNYVFLEGVGGIGKTELAKSYAKANEKNYDIVQFVQYQGSLEFTIANNLRFDDDISRYKNEVSEKDKFKDKMGRLSKYDKKTLIIIDNYDDVKEEDDYTDIVAGKYKVIFTSREKRGGIKLEGMGEDDLVAMFLGYYGETSNKLSAKEITIIKDIIELVSGHTMTIMLIALAMQNGRKKPAEMLEKLKTGLDTELPTSFKVKKEGIEKNSKKMYQHMLTLFDMTEIKNNFNLAHIMTNMAIVPYTGIEENSFCQWVLKDLYPDKEINYDDLNWLIERRWIQKDMETNYISLHPVISDIANNVLKPDSKKCEGLIKGLVMPVIGDINVYKFYSYRHIIFKKSPNELINISNFLEFALLRINDVAKLNAVAILLFLEINNLKNRYSIVLKYSLIYVKKFKSASEDINYSFSEVYFTIGKLYLEQNKFPKADDFLQKAYILQKKYGLTTHEHINEYLLIASRYKNMEKAWIWYNRALVASKKFYGPGNPKIADIYQSIAGRYSDNGQYDEALKWLKKVKLLVYRPIKNINFTTFPSKVDLMPVYRDFAMIYQRRENYPWALFYLQKALEIEENALSRLKITDVPQSYRLIVELYHKKGDLKKENEWLKKWETRVTKASEEERSENYTDYTYYANIAEYFLNTKNYSEALKWYRRGLKKPSIRFINIEKFFPTDLYDKIADTYLAMENIPAGIKWKKKSLLENLNMYGQISPSAVRYFGEITNLLLKKGDYEEVKKWLKRWIAALGKETNEDYWAVLSFIQIASFYNCLDKPKAALKWIKKAREIIDKEKFFLTSDVYFHYYLVTGEICFRMKKFMKAIKLYSSALKAHKISGTNPENIIRVYNSIFWVYIDTKEYEKGLRFFQEAKRNTPDKDVIVKKELANLMSKLLYAKTGKYLSPPAVSLITEILK